jgi:hypothetical protein
LIKKLRDDVESVPSQGRGSVCLCDTLQEKSSGFLRNVEPQLKVGALTIDLRYLCIEQEIGILHSEPPLRLVLNQTTELSRAVSGFASQNQPRFHRVLQGEREAKQLRRIEQLGCENRMKHFCELRRVSRDEAKRVALIQGLEAIE